MQGSTAQHSTAPACQTRLNTASLAALARRHTFLISSSSASRPPAPVAAPPPPAAHTTAAVTWQPPNAHARLMGRVLAATE